MRINAVYEKIHNRSRNTVEIYCFQLIDGTDTRKVNPVPINVIYTTTETLNEDSLQKRTQFIF